MNKAILLGRLCRDPETRTTSNQTPVSSFTIAIDRPYKDSSGNKQTDFLPVVAWRKLSELVQKYFKKGDRILIVGSIQVRSWDDADGNKHSITEIIADEISFVDSKKDAQTAPQAEQALPYDI
jgi:single-strand DNA-binding protein